MKKSGRRMKKIPSCPASRWAFSTAAASSSSVTPSRSVARTASCPAWTASQARRSLSISPGSFTLRCSRVTGEMLTKSAPGQAFRRASYCSAVRMSSSVPILPGSPRQPGQGACENLLEPPLFCQLLPADEDVLHGKLEPAPYIEGVVIGGDEQAGGLGRPRVVEDIPGIDEKGCVNSPVEQASSAAL